MTTGKWYFFFCILFINACSNLPTNIQNPPTVDILLSQAIEQNVRYEKAPIRWGGTIIDLENESNSSQMQILAYPLNYFGRPITNKPAYGRFIIISKQFLDPAIYSKDKELTVAGVLKGITEKKIGNKTINLPLVSVDNIHLWPEYRQNYYRHYYNDPYFYGYHDRFYPYNNFRGRFGYYYCD